MPRSVHHIHVTGLDDSDELTLINPSYYDVDVKTLLNSINDAHDAGNTTEQIDQRTIDRYKDDCYCPYCLAIRGWVCARHAAIGGGEYSFVHPHPHARFGINYTSLTRWIKSVMSGVYDVSLMLATIRTILDSSICDICGEDHAVWMNPNNHSSAKVCTNCLLDEELTIEECYGCESSSVSIDGTETIVHTDGFEYSGDGEWLISRPGTTVPVCTICRDMFYCHCTFCNSNFLMDSGGLQSIFTTDAIREAYNRLSRESRVGYSALDSDGELIPVCGRCSRDQVTGCNSCNEVIMDSASVTVNGRRYCQGCIEGAEECPECIESYFGSQCRCESGDVIRNYTFKPDPILYYTSKRERADDKRKTMYFGVEIELEYNGRNHLGTSAAKVLNAINGQVRATNKERRPFMFAKSDATINNGCEFVTNPFSPDWLKYNHKAFEAFFSESKEQGFHTQGNCGLHIHISRTKHGLLRTRLYKLCHLIYGHPFFTDEISGRINGLTSYCSVNESKKELLSKARRGSGGDRGAINCNKDKTIELRFFVAPKSFDEFLLRVETTKALLAFSRDVSIRDATPRGFADYVHSRKYNDALLKLTSKYKGN